MHEEFLDIKQNIESIQGASEQAIMSEYIDHIKQLATKNLDIEEVVTHHFSFII